MTRWKEFTHHFNKSILLVWNLLYVITSVINLCLRGKCLVSLIEFVVSPHLMLLLKLEGRIQSIAMGFVWRWLVFTVVMKWVSKYIAQYLKDFQFRVVVLGGAKANLHNAPRVSSKRHGDGSLIFFRYYFLILWTW